MSIKLIPREQDLEDVDDALLELIRDRTGDSELDDYQLTHVAKKKLTTYNAEIEAEISRIHERISALKTAYINELINTYIGLDNAIGAAVRGDKKLAVTITGEYPSTSEPRSMNRWAQCNPGTIDAINYIMAQLRRGGSNPKLDWSVEGDDKTAEVLITCDLTK
jgi:hypothetical protein